MWAINYTATTYFPSEATLVCMMYARMHNIEYELVLVVLVIPSIVIRIIQAHIYLLYVTSALRKVRTPITATAKLYICE